ncbi:hypothetical protein K2173_006589 [Erythroxylum novogranatense]|uniref:Exonuclease 1 n=1 Tax=Erythroxylum novogranatense TaxID=1862640 RepID=A0AAV8T5L0_9ROSI|nr:hypothetical protein K2173_006589 [Erythroxylum novogranatense]
MGIQGLLPLLKSIMVPIHVKDLEGCCVAVDTYSWLHKGALSCSTQLCKGLPTTRHIEYCMHRVNLLRHYGVKPILVFDGGILPMKIEQENKRARARKENLTRAREHESNGNSAAAYECYQKAVDISPSIALQLIQVLKQEDVSYIVAPYEADAQMTFLAVNRQVDAVISEDSDLIPFGCPRIIFKMDKYGQGVEFQQSRLHQNKEINFSGFTKQMLLEMCILSGCDYLQSLPGMGLKRAHALITKFKSHDKIIKHLRYTTVCVPPGYEESFRKAIMTFQHQRVYNPDNENIVYMSHVSDDPGYALDFLGPLIPQHIAKGIAKGELDPFTQMPFQEERASSEGVLQKISEFRKSKLESGKKKLDLPVQKNVLTKYFCFASLEAKRTFRVPRKSPISSPKDISNPNIKEDCHLDVASCDMNCSAASPIDSDKVEKPPPKSAVESDLSDEVRLSESGSPDLVDGSPGHTLLLKLGDSTVLPSQALLKQCKGKTMVENKRPVVRSSYFKKKLVTKDDQTDRQERLLLNDFANDSCGNIALKTSCNSNTENRNVIMKSPDIQLCLMDKNNQDEKLGFVVEDDQFNDARKGIFLEGFNSEDGYPNNRSTKRKSSSDDFLEKENIGFKHTRTSAQNLDNTIMEEMKPEEAKFGSDISHLNHYCNIAERSMERFASMISSFRFSSSGSRASGLRAPLRDIRKSCPSRPTVDMDFNQFAYVPSNQKTVLGSRRH